MNEHNGRWDLVRDDLKMVKGDIRRLEDRVGKLSEKVVIVSVITGGMVTIGNIVAALMLRHFFGMFGGG